MLKVPGSNPGPGIKKLILLEKFFIFEVFWKKLLLAQKTATSQTHFGFTNLGSECHQSNAIAIWNSKISNETPV